MSPFLSIPSLTVQCLAQNCRIPSSWVFLSNLDQFKMYIKASFSVINKQVSLTNMETWKGYSTALDLEDGGGGMDRGGIHWKIYISLLVGCWSWIIGYSYQWISDGPLQGPISQSSPLPNCSWSFKPVFIIGYCPWDCIPACASKHVFNPLPALPVFFIIDSQRGNTWFLKLAVYETQYRMKSLRYLIGLH